jgi:hypothetical protein
MAAELARDGHLDMLVRDLPAEARPRLLGNAPVLRRIR